MTNKIVIVDENDNAIGEATKQEALHNGLCKRIVRIILVNGNKIYLQKRSKNAFPFPDKWDKSAGGHVDAGGETYLDAAKRELFEELGIDNIDLIEIGKNYLEVLHDGFPGPSKFFNMDYIGFYSGDEIKLDKKEVSYGQWFTFEEVDKLVSEQPDTTTIGLKMTWDKYSNKIKHYLENEATNTNKK